MQTVIENPDVVSERGRYGRTLRKEVMDPHGRRIDLAVEVADAPRLSEYDYQIVTLYPERGDWVQALGNDGNVAEVKLDG